MSVTESLVLPAQPTSGKVTLVPLGGDGFSAPHAAYMIETMLATGDASGTFVRLQVTMDERFCSLPSYVTGQIGQATPADADYRWTFGTTVDQGVLVNTADVVSSAVNCAKTWRPPPVIQPGGGKAAKLFMTYKNVDGDTYFLDSLIYLFDIRARERGPLGYLLWQMGAS